MYLLKGEQPPFCRKGGSIQCSQSQWEDRADAANRPHGGHILPSGRGNRSNPYPVEVVFRLRCLDSHALFCSGRDCDVRGTGRRIFSSCGARRSSDCLPGRRPVCRTAAAARHLAQPLDIGMGRDVGGAASQAWGWRTALGFRTSQRDVRRTRPGFGAAFRVGGSQKRYGRLGMVAAIPASECSRQRAAVCARNNG